MKHILLTFLLFAGSIGLKAQGAAAQQLFFAIEEAENGKLLVKQSRIASNMLVKQLTVTLNPNTAQFLNSLNLNQNGLIDVADNVHYHTEQAWSLSGQAFNKQQIITQANLIYNLVDEVNGLAQLIVDAVNSNNTQTALTLITTFNQKLQNQTQALNRIKTRCNNAISLVRTYEVCVRTVNSNGIEVPPSDLFGFYAINDSTGEVFYPDNQEGTCFLSLSSGTYTFGAFPGYFSGASSTTVTLNQNLINSNGIVVVDLVYWSE
jgi:uncharacterized HAD superfamily protein